MEECPICIEELGKKTRTLNCGHVFHTKCLRKNEEHNYYIKNEKKFHQCPYCRTPYLNLNYNKDYVDFKNSLGSRIKIVNNNILNNNEKVEILIDTYNFVLKEDYLFDSNYGLTGTLLVDFINKLHFLTDEMREKKENIRSQLIKEWDIMKENFLFRFNQITSPCPGP